MKRKILTLLTAFSLFLSGCSLNEFRLTEIELDGFSCYLADQEATSREPVIVVTFDLYGSPEETYTSDVCIDEMIEKSENRIEQILNELDKEQICDISQLGIYGYSLGGMTAFYTAAYGNISPKVIMTIAAIPDFKYVIENCSDSMAAKYSVEKRRFVLTTDSDNQHLLAWAESKDDPYMSIDKVREFQKAIEENGGNIQVFENQGGTHSDPGDYHVESILDIVYNIFKDKK